MTIWVLGSSFNIASVADMPSISGMLMSMMTTCGWDSRASVRASLPVRAPPTTSISRSNCSRRRIFSLVSAISSTIRTRILSATVSLPYFDGNVVAQNGDVGHIDPRHRSVGKVGRQVDFKIIHQALQIHRRHAEHGGVAGGPHSVGKVGLQADDKADRQRFLRRHLDDEDVRN